MCYKGRTMELFDIVDENGIPTGEQVERSIAHAKGILHRTAHLWLFRKKDGKIQVLLQKRSQNKDSFPGCYDISSAGHIPAGVDYIPSALRELEEELGIHANSEELILCGKRRIQYKERFHHKLFHDNQITNVYLIWKDLEVNDMKLQESEVESVIWMDFNQCIESVTMNKIKHCIMLEELNILKDALIKFFSY